MKIKNIYIFIAAVLLLVGALFWKLNDYYKYEKFGEVRGRLRQQSLSLKTSVGSQVEQLKNIVSSYTGQIDESKINWVQLNPFYALARVSIGTKGNYIVKTLFTKSGTPADKWDQAYLQKAISFNPHKGLPLQVQMFQNQQGEKFVAIVFGDATGYNVTDATLLIGDANYFQKFFEIQKNKKTIHFLATTDGVVVAHTESEYIANKTNETKLNPKKFILEKDDIRSSNLVVYSYVSPQGNAGWYVPFFITAFILGLTLVCVGLVLYVYKPVRASVSFDVEGDTPERALEKEKIFNQVLNEVKRSSNKLDEPSLPAPSASFKLKPIQQLEEPKPLPVVEAAPEVDQSFFMESTPVNEPKHDNDTLQSLAESFSADAAATTDELYTLSHILDKSVGPYQNQIQLHKEVFSERMYMMNENRMVKAFENLIKNSIEAQAAHLNIRIERVHGEDVVTLTDDGVGINPNLLKEVVVPFYTTKNKNQHRGLGLPEAISIFERYGAEIEIKSLENGSKGTQIVVKMKPTDNTQVSSDVVSSLNMNVENLDLELDSILELDTQSMPIEKMLDSYEAGLAQEAQNIQFQVNPKIEIEKNPSINIAQPKRQAIDQFDVQIRQPKLKGEDQL